MHTITYKRIIIIGCIIAIGLGMFLHFAYDLSYGNSLVGLFAPVNESVWEHLKLIFIPFTLFSLTLYFISKRKFSNMILATVFGNIVGMFTTVVLYYVGLYFFKQNNMIYNIIVLILGIVSAFSILYSAIYNKEFLEETADSTIIGTCTLVLLFAIFALSTYFPIRSELMKDPITKTYGIERTA